MGNAIALALNNFANFRGRTTRRNFWFFYLFTVLVGIPTSLLDRLLFPGKTYIETWAGIFFLLPLISSAVRRMHDVNKRGIWIIVPFANLFFAVQPSGPMNRFDVVI